MSRPAAKVVLEHIDKKTFKSDQILEAEAIWAVFYKEKPFNLKSQNSLGSYSGNKYKKVSFSNRGHAINLCRKLNIQFGTTEFSVVKLNKGEIVR